jgi:ribosomal protein S6--L-glutamate ligase
MKICLLTESTPSPVLVSALDLIARRHAVVDCPPDVLAGGFGHRPAHLRDVDLYLLKSRSEAAQAYARDAHSHGAQVLNTPEGTAAALDRATMATRLFRARVPAPRCCSATTLRHLVAALRSDDLQPAPRWPLVLKSRRSRRGDLVTRVDDLDDLVALLPEWADEPVVAQEFMANDGYDLKFWVIGEHLTVARRPCALEQRTTAHDVGLDPRELPPDWLTVVRRAGAALDLEIFGVDVVVTDRGPSVIDVNAFPGFRCAADADFALAELVERHVASGRLSA